MGKTDAELMEASLIAVADAGVELRFDLFERFFAAWPERRASFLNVDAASRRMTDETLEMMLGLAKRRGQLGVALGRRTGVHPPKLRAVALGGI